jgi:purine-binding chemotaxis protein CheW
MVAGGSRASFRATGRDCAVGTLARTRLLVFRLDGQRYALALGSVERVIQVVELTPLPGAPAIVAGAIDVEGRILPVFCLRRRLQQPSREIIPSDQLLIARIRERTVALLIDEAQGVIECEASAVVDPSGIVPGLEQFQGLVQLADGLVLIHDLPKFLSADEVLALDCAMGRIE